MKIKFVSFFVFCFVLLMQRPGVSEPQVFFHLASSDESVLIDNGDFSKLAEATAQAVVDVQTESSKNVYVRVPFFQQYFQTIDPRSGKPLQEVSKSSGSAVIISDDGYLITCAHVVENANKITVKLADLRKFTATVVAHYPEIDLAILKIENNKDAKLPYLKIGSMKNVKSGALVAALGNALNLGQTFTDGHISAPRRRLNNPTGNSSFIVLQHNAAVNPGNSGGALVDKYGNLIGINNAMLTNASSVGFSISIDFIKDYLDKFFNKNDGCWFGLYDLKSIDQDTVNKMQESGFSYSGGLFVTNVKDDTPVKAAGLLQKDIIVAINDRLVEMPEDLRMRESVLEANKVAEMRVWRDGKIITLMVTPIVHPKEKTIEGISVKGDHPLSGLQVVGLTPELAEKIHVPSDTKGLLVINNLPAPVEMGALSLFGGGSFIQKGDLLVKVNAQKVETPQDLEKALKIINDKKSFSVVLLRQGQELQISIDGSTTLQNQFGGGNAMQKPDQDSKKKSSIDQSSAESLEIQQQLQDLISGVVQGQGKPVAGGGAANGAGQGQEHPSDQVILNLPVHMT